MTHQGRESSIDAVYRHWRAQVWYNWAERRL